MLKFGGLIAMPYCIPLIWGTLIKRAPAWSGWTTVVLGFATSWAGQQYLTPNWLEKTFGWSPLSGRESEDWKLLVGVLLDVIVCSAWFLGTCAFASQRSAQEVERVETFMQRMSEPVDYDKEEGQGNDAQQYRTLGLLALIYGTGILLLVLIPNSGAGRLGMIFCAACMLGTGGILYRHARRAAVSASAAKAPLLEPADKS